MHDADILLTRTRTKCNSALLDASPCTFIGTATIGTDHIDLDYCRSKGIEVANAPGCNAPAVGQYVLAAIARNLKPGETFADKTLGIIGAGNVGSLVGRWARATGMKVLLNDPPKEEQGDDGNCYVSLDEIAEKCDVITIHTPLTTGAKHPTFHLVGKEFLSGLVRRPLLINSARGPVTDTVALKQAYTDGLVSALAIDCWRRTRHRYGIACDGRHSHSTYRGIFRGRKNPRDINGARCPRPASKESLRHGDYSRGAEIKSALRTERARIRKHGCSRL
ncbi:NAD(P)-dependent oxidoreductase [Duncaniella dubosii]|nr:NAD(P)-dependent oxidoreductase [Duncaniella dubosii]